MSDADWKRAQTEPLAGEGDKHFRSKQRVAGILRRCGLYTEVEHRFYVSIEGLHDPLQLRADVFAVSPDRSICVEVDGPGYHKSQRAFRKDEAKKRAACEAFKLDPKKDYHAFSYKEILGYKPRKRKANKRTEPWTDKEIAEVMGLAVALDRSNMQWL